MPMAQGLLAELNHEMAGTRKLLERVPDGRFDWRPHPKSTTLGRLATHLAELPGWAHNAMTATELEILPTGQTPPRHILPSTAEVLALFDENLALARTAIKNASDPDFMVPWTLKRAGVSVLTMPRLAVIRSMVLSHSIHHRAQLGVFLRLLDVPLPMLYGPTADERA